MILKIGGSDKNEYIHDQILGANVGTDMFQVPVVGLEAASQWEVWRPRSSTPNMKFPTKTSSKKPALNLHEVKLDVVKEETESVSIFK